MMRCMYRYAVYTDISQMVITFNESGEAEPIFPVVETRQCGRQAVPGYVFCYEHAVALGHIKPEQEEKPNG